MPLWPCWDDVSPAYLHTRIPILDKDGNTTKVAYPFIWDHTHLKAHPNGVLIYSDQKRLEFLLQWVTTWHNLIPPTPLFWVTDDKGAKSMSLHRTSLWLHKTIDWLAQTSEAFPVELHDSIMPRIEKITKANLKPPRHQDPRSPDGRNALHTQQMNSRNPTLALRKYHLRRLMMPRSQTKTRGTCCCRQAMRTWPRNLTQRTR